MGRAGPGGRPREARGDGEPGAGHRRDRGGRRRARGAEPRRDAAVRDRRSDRGRRAAPPAVPLPRPAPSRDDADHAAACRREPDHARAHGRARLPRGGDADPHALDAGRGARLPRALADVPGHVLRAAAVAAAAEAAADGRRPGPLLPDRAVPARRADDRRPGPRVHAARRRDVLRRRGRSLRRHRASLRADHRGDPGRRGAHALPAHDVRRDARSLRLGQARPPLRDGARHR